MLSFRLAVATVALSASPAVAQPSEQANRSAYVYSMRCFAAAASVIADTRSTTAEVEAAKQRSRRAFDGAVRLGRVLGLSGQAINEDINATGRAEATLMARDPGYLRRTQTVCAQLGL
jgi:hypothetical protein